MPGPLLHPGATIQCAHVAPATIAPSQGRVLVNGMPVALATDVVSVAGCVFVAGSKPQPCVLVRWLVPAARVLVMGAPPVTQASGGLCFSAEQIPQGPAIVSAAQPRVVAT